MELTINFYNRQYPKKGEIVTIIMKEPENDKILSTIEEYPYLSGLMQISDLTSKKRIRSVRQYLHKKPVPAEVVDIDNKTNVIYLTRKYLKLTEESHQKNYFDKLKFLNITKNILRINSDNSTEENLEKIIKKIIYPTMDLINKNEPIINNIEKLFNNDELPDYGEYNNIMNNTLTKMFSEQIIKYRTQISLMCSKSVNNIIDLFKELNKIYPKTKFILDTTPNYIIETKGLKEEEIIKHQLILETIENLCKKNNIAYKF